MTNDDLVQEMGGVLSRQNNKFKFRKQPAGRFRNPVVLTSYSFDEKSSMETYLDEWHTFTQAATSFGAGSETEDGKDDLGNAAILKLVSSSTGGRSKKNSRKAQFGLQEGTVCLHLFSIATFVK